MAAIRIADLPGPITAAKADWLPGTTWLGFTPVDDSPNAIAQCMSSINRQFGHGYVIEYNTLKFGDVNPGFEKDPRYLAEKDAHKENAGRLLSVHKLRPTGRPLREILGDQEYEDIQSRWAEDGRHYRWSVAFPIIESYEIAGRPRANEILDAPAMQRLFGHPSRTLRPLIDRERDQISNLQLLRTSAPNAWIAIEDEISIAERPENTLLPKVESKIESDLKFCALEGLSAERRAKVKKRAAWLADKFLRGRLRKGSLCCDGCDFDPVRKVGSSGVNPRTLMDVHHRDPIAEGVRYTTISDFALLCPNCHRFEHAILRALKKQSTSG